MSNKLACLNQISTFLQVPISKLVLNNEKMPTCIIENKPITGFLNIVLTLLKQSKKQEIIFGTRVDDEAEIRQWLEYCTIFLFQITNTQHTSQILQELNQFLLTRTYFVGHTLTIADVAIFYILQHTMEKMSYLEKEKYLNLSRWFDNIQQNNEIRSNKSFIDFSTIILTCH